MSPDATSSLVAKADGAPNASSTMTSYHSTSDHHPYHAPRATSGSEHVFSGAGDRDEHAVGGVSSPPPTIALNVNGGGGSGTGAHSGRYRPTSIDLSEYDDKTYQSRPAFAEHLGKHRQYWRDIILGVNDGLVSTFLLVAGVAGGGLPTKDILLTAVAGALAGAVSMYAGEYVATKSQNEVLTGEIAMENRHVRDYRADELRELNELLTLIGLPDRPPGEGGGGDGDGDGEDAADGAEGDDGDDSGDGEGWELRERMMYYYERNGDALLKIMVALEFGVLEEETRSPCAAGLTSCGLFFLGSLPSVVPFAIVENSTSGLIAAGLATGTALFAVGAVKTWATRGGWLSAAVENFVIAGVGGAFAYGVGVGFERAIRQES